MSIRLVDEHATTQVDIEGTVFHVKHLPRSGRQKFIDEMVNLVAEEGVHPLVNLLARYVVKIEGFETMPVGEVLDRMAASFNPIITRIVDPLSERESKNSKSSPGSCSTNSAGTLTAEPVTPDDGDVSSAAEL